MNALVASLEGRWLGENGPVFDDSPYSKKEKKQSPIFGKKVCILSRPTSHGTSSGFNCVTRRECWKVVAITGTRHGGR